MIPPALLSRKCSRSINSVGTSRLSPLLVTFARHLCSHLCSPHLCSPLPSPLPSPSVTFAVTFAPFGGGMPGCTPAPDSDNNQTGVEGTPICNQTGSSGGGGTAVSANNTGAKIPPLQVTQLQCTAGFIKASNDAWMRATNGFAKTEAGFWVTGNPNAPSFSPLPFTNQQMTITGLNIPAGALALVHTHPNSGIAPPSPGDVKNSNDHKIPFYVLSSRGLWLHNPGSPTSTMLRPGLTWQKPC